MSYIRAEAVLPPELLAYVQTFVEGQMLYIPKRDPKRSQWGSVSGTKEYYRKRNAMICADADAGVDIQVLADRYYLSEKTIQRILLTGRALSDLTTENEEPI